MSIWYNSQKAYVLGIKDMKRRRQLAENEKKEKKAKSQARKEKQNN